MMLLGIEGMGSRGGAEFSQKLNRHIFDVVVNDAVSNVG
jgi:hypothetical protein